MQIKNEIIIDNHLKVAKKKKKNKTLIPKFSFLRKSVKLYDHKVI